MNMTTKKGNARVSHPLAFFFVKLFEKGYGGKLFSFLCREGTFFERRSPPRPLPPRTS